MGRTKSARGAAPVLNHNRLSQVRFGRAGERSQTDIGGGAGQPRHNQRDWPRRISLRSRYAWRGGQRGRACSQMQKFSAEKIHDVPSEDDCVLRPRFMERGGLAAIYSGLMLAARITLPHLSVSAAMSLLKSAGEPGSALPPSSAKRAVMPGSAKAALISLLRVPTISGDVRRGAPMPNHDVTS